MPALPRGAPMAESGPQGLAPFQPGPNGLAPSSMLPVHPDHRRLPRPTPQQPMMPQPQHRPHHPPHAQLPMAAPPVMPDLLELIHNHQGQPEFLHHPEAKVIRQALENGDLNPLLILNQFANASDGLSNVQKDILVNYIKLFQRQGKLPTRMTPHIRDLLRLPSVGGRGVTRPPPAAAFAPTHAPMMPAGAPEGADPAIIMSRAQPMPQPQPQMGGAPPPLPFEDPAVIRLPMMMGPPQQQLGPEDAQQQLQMLQNKVLHKNGGRRPQSGHPRPQAPQHEASPPAGKASSSSPASLPFTPMAVMKKLAAGRRDSDQKERQPRKTPTAEEDESASGARKKLEEVLAAGSKGGEEGLSRFFSADLLAKANAGQAPNMPPLPMQKAMTLDQIE